MSYKETSRFLMEKVKLRVDNLPSDKPLKVLDFYHGDGTLWNLIKERTGRDDIVVVGVEKNRRKSGVYLHGDNRTFRFSYDDFHVVDCDAWGDPNLLLLDICMRSRAPLSVFFTLNFLPTGRQSNVVYEVLGYTKAMVRKVPTLFGRCDPIKRVQEFLSLIGVKKLKCYYDLPNDRRLLMYGFFRLNEKE